MDATPEPKPEPNLTMDLRAMKYPGTLKETKACLLQIPVKDVLELFVSDVRSTTDLPTFVRGMGHDVWVDQGEGFYTVVIRKNCENY